MSTDLVQHKNGSVAAIQEPAGAEDFDAFWTEVGRKQVVLKNVFGVDLVLPPTLPLQLELEMKIYQKSDKVEDIGRLCRILFRLTDEEYQRWIDAGMDVEQFSVLLMWGLANASGNPMTLADVRQEYMDKQQKKESGGAVDPK